MRFAERGVGSRESGDPQKLRTYRVHVIKHKISYNVSIEVNLYLYCRGQKVLQG